MAGGAQSSGSYSGSNAAAAVSSRPEAWPTHRPKALTCRHNRRLISASSSSPMTTVTTTMRAPASTNEPYRPGLRCGDASTTRSVLDDQPGPPGQMVFDLEPEHEVEQVVVPDRGPGLLFENLGRDLPDVGGDPAADQQRHHVVVGGLANAVVADRTGEGVRRQRSVGADVEADLGSGQLDLTTAWAGCADRRHTVASLSLAEPPVPCGGLVAEVVRQIARNPCLRRR